LIDDDFQIETKRSEFKAELIQHHDEGQRHNQGEVGSVIIVNHLNSHTPYIPSPKK